MQYINSAAFCLFFLILCSFCAGTARAAAITNLDETPQNIELRTAEGFQAIDIASGKTWRVPGAAEIRFHERRIYLRENDEFAIWKNGQIGPQRYITHSKGSLQ